MYDNIDKNLVLRRLAEILALAILYFLTAKIGQLIAVPPGNVTPLWIPSGIILAAVLLRGYWIWPGIFIGAFVGNVSSYIDFESVSNIGLSIFTGCMNGLGDSLGAVLGAWLIRLYTDSNKPLHMSAHIAVFLIAGVLLGSVISASFGVTSLAIAGFVEWSNYAFTWVTWCVGDAVGLLIITPFILSFAGEQPPAMKPGRKLEIPVYAIFMLVITAFCLELIDLPLSYQLPLFLVAPVLIWSVLRFYEHITFFSIIFITVLAAIATTKGTGPFVQADTITSLIQLQLFIATMSITILVLNAVVIDRQKINQTLKRTHRQLENLVEERTQKLSEALQRERELNRGLEQTSNELKLTQKQLLHSQKMEALGTLAGGIAHDFNNILNVMMGNADLAQDKLPDNSPVKKYLNTVVNSGERAAKLVKQILTFSRLKTENFTTINLSEVVGDAVKMTRSTIPMNVDIQCDIDNEEISILGDVTQVHQIILNLCTNAYHSMNQNGGEIKIELKSHQNCPVETGGVTDCALLRIKDNGVGISAEVLQRIFDPFFTTKEVGKGTGLGLSVVHGIVDNHNGDISVTSEPGVGTQFEIFFPITTQELDKSIGGVGPTVATESRNILIVDDEVEIVKLYRQFLEMQGYHVISSINPVEALQIYEHHSSDIDVVITDQSMPNMTGKEFSRSVLSINSDAKVILTTGYSDAIDEEIASQIGICDFIVKPVKLSHLMSRIEECFN